MTSMELSTNRHMREPETEVCDPAVWYHVRCHSTVACSAIFFLPALQRSKVQHALAYSAVAAIVPLFDIFALKSINRNH